MESLEHIIHACLNKETRAENALYKKCYTLLINICRRYAPVDDDAIDLLNRSFLKIIQNLKTYDTERDFDKWAISITVNTVIDEFRKRKNHAALFSTLEFNELKDFQLPFELNKAEENLHANEIFEQIRQLPEGSREVFNLYLFEGLSHREIGERLQISENTSRWHLANARNRLKARIDAVLGKLKYWVL